MALTLEKRGKLAKSIKELREIRLTEKWGRKVSQVELGGLIRRADKATLSEYESAKGPSVDVLPALAAVAADIDAFDLAAQFLEAFMDEYPDLWRVVTPLISTNKASIPGGANVEQIRSRRDLHRVVDRIVKSGNKVAVHILEKNLEALDTMPEEGE